ncbi:MAG: family 10 glycosylhydrolase [Anaerolineae bacterium]|nr:family 10 glycosylhydrolase [Anaerolineae bacterium]
MRKPAQLALVCAVGALAIALLLWMVHQPTRADDPVPWEEYGGLDGYYLARGWTEGYVSKKRPPLGPGEVPAALTHTVYLPLVMRGQVLKETRALWVTRWDFRTVSDVQAIVDNAAYANLNVILFQVRGQADALYTPGLEPWSAVLSGTLGANPGWDPLAEIIARAHARGLEVQAWINVYPVWLGTTPPPDAQPRPMYHAFNDAYGDQWLHWYCSPQVGPTTLNSHYLWGSPGHPAVADRIVAVCRDLLTRYELDGLHFDYVRYNDQGRPYSCDPLSQAAYVQASAGDPTLTYADWRRAQITALLARVRQEALPLRPNARLTTSAWPIYDKTRYDWFPSTGPDGYSDLYQDSLGWARQGTVSAIMPMLYTASVHDYRDRFAQLSQDFVSGAQTGGVVIGIEGNYDNFADPFAEIAWRIEAARQAGARGQCLFSYRLFDERNYWQALRDGPYRTPAAPNWP